MEVSHVQEDGQTSKPQLVCLSSRFFSECSKHAGRENICAAFGNQHFLFSAALGCFPKYKSALSHKTVRPLERQIVCMSRRFSSEYPKDPERVSFLGRREVGLVSQHGQTPTPPMRQLILRGIVIRAGNVRKRPGGE